MTLLCMEGFEDFNTDAQLKSDSKILTTTAISFSTGRINGQAVVANASDDIFLYLESVSTGTTVYFGYAMKHSSLPFSTGSQVALLSDDGVTMWNIYMTATTGLLQFRRGTTIVGTGTIAPTIGAWNYIVFKVLISNTVGTVESWVNGTKDLDLTNQDTDNGGGNIATAKLQSQSGISTLEYDDFYLGDDAGTDMTDEQGDCHIEQVVPNANGTTNNFTASPAVANYLNVDDGDTPDDDTTYNHSSTATDKELYGCASLVGPVQTVHAVQVRARARKEDAGNRLINLICRNNVTEVDSGQLGLSTDYVSHSKIFENDPDGGGNWTEADVNSMEVGFEIGT